MTEPKSRDHIGPRALLKKSKIAITEGGEYSLDELSVLTYEILGGINVSTDHNSAMDVLYNTDDPLYLINRHLVFLRRSRNFVTENEETIEFLNQIRNDLIRIRLAGMDQTPILKDPKIARGLRNISSLDAVYNSAPHTPEHTGGVALQSFEDFTNLSRNRTTDNGETMMQGLKRRSILVDASTIRKLWPIYTSPVLLVPFGMDSNSVYGPFFDQPKFDYNESTIKVLKQYFLEYKDFLYPNTPFTNDPNNQVSVEEFYEFMTKKPDTVYWSFLLGCVDVSGYMAMKYEPQSESFTFSIGMLKTRLKIGEIAATVAFAIASSLGVRSIRAISFRTNHLGQNAFVRHFGEPKETHDEQLVFEKGLDPLRSKLDEKLEKH